MLYCRHFKAFVVPFNLCFEPSKISKYTHLGFHLTKTILCQVADAVQLKYWQYTSLIPEVIVKKLYKLVLQINVNDKPIQNVHRHMIDLNWLL